MKILFKTGKLAKFGWNKATVLKPSTIAKGQTAKRRSKNMAGG
jgi:hypothetical protein